MKLRSVGALAAAPLMALLLACGKGDAAFKSYDIGDAMPGYAVASLTGDTLRVGGAATQPLTVLNVWATWCESCRDEMDDLNSLVRDFKDRGVRVAGVSVDGGDGFRVRRFAESQKLEFVVAHDPAQVVQSLYRVVAVPETYVIGADGRLLWRHVGNLRPVLDSLRGVLTLAMAPEAKK